MDGFKVLDGILCGRMQKAFARIKSSHLDDLFHRYLHSDGTFPYGPSSTSLVSSVYIILHCLTYAICDIYIPEFQLSTISIYRM